MRRARSAGLAAAGSCLLTGILAATVHGAAPDQGDSRGRSIYIVATDQQGNFVEDLAPEDFQIKEGGKVAEVRRVGLDDTPIQVAIIVDDSGTGLFRSSLVRFIQRLQGRAEFSLTSVVGQPLKLVDFTSGDAALSQAVNSLSARPGTPDGGQLLQGVYDAAKDFEQRKAPRPVILVLTIPGEEHSTIPAKYVLEQLRDSGASLNVFMAAGSASRQTVAVTRPSALLGENLALSEVLGDGPKQSGGHYEEIVAAPGFVLGVQRLAEELIHQYVVDYVLPPGAKRSDRINVSVKRKGINLRAPSKVPKG
jgi:hypothetical protein